MGQGALEEHRMPNPDETCHYVIDTFNLLPRVLPLPVDHGILAGFPISPSMGVDDFFKALSVLTRGTPQYHA
jgi:hypothetical protein